MSVSGYVCHIMELRSQNEVMPPGAGPDPNVNFDKKVIFEGADNGLSVRGQMDKSFFPPQSL